MKKLSLIVAIAFAFTACSDNSTNADMHTHDHDMKSEGSAQIAEGPIDPICDMVKGDDWTEYSVIEGDTTWFCSPVCKETFDKDPSKYPTK